MASRFYISIARKDGGEVMLYPGGQGELDLIKTVSDQVGNRNFVHAVVDEVVSKGVMFRSIASVKKGLEEELGSVISKHVGDVLREILRKLKSEVRP